MELMIYALPFLWQGLLVTLGLAGLVVLFSLLVGVILGVAIAYGGPVAYWPIRVYSDIVRAIPLLVLIFFIYYGLPVLEVQISNFWAAVLALSLFKTGHVIEIVRGCIQSIHPGQIDAGKSIGLTFVQRLAWVVAPQALRRFLPPWLNSVTDSVKGSALASLVGVVDLMLSIQQVIGRTFEPLPLYLLGAIIYFIINYSLSQASRRLEARYAYIRE